MVATAILGLTAGGWHLAIDLLKLATHKEPVPWPESVRVDEKTFQNTSFATKLGPFELAANGERKYEELVMELLKIGTSLDRGRVGQRQSNWYFSRLYVDKRDDRPPRLWQLDVTYYTGGLDKVPHIPEICLVAGGATLVDSSEARFEVPGAPSPWDKPLDFRRVQYERMDERSGAMRQAVQYYIFSLNGEPESNRLKIRRKLTYPSVKHCYFAKIQFAPSWAVTDTDETDRAAQEFIASSLPIVLQVLPSGRDIKRLDAGGPAAE